MDELGLRGGVATTVGGVMATTGGVNTYTTTAQISFMIDGVLRTKGTVAGGTTPTTDINTGVAVPVLPINTGVAVVWALKSDGTVVVAVSRQAALDASGNFQRAPEWPPVPANMCPFAYTILKNGATGSNWTFGTSNWNATGMTVSTKDIMWLPSRPQVS